MVVSTASYSMIGPTLAPASTERSIAPPPQHLLPPPVAPVTPTHTPRASTTRSHRAVAPDASPTLSAPAEQGGDDSEAPAVPTDVPSSTAESAPSDCTIENRWGDVEPRARQVACLLDETYPGITEMLGVAPRGLAGSGHPKGLAVDFLINQDRVTGDAIAACAAAHFADWDLDYVLWRQRSLEDAGGEFEPMADRGGATANHMDHVHLSFHRRSDPIPQAALSCAEKEENRP